MAFSAPGRDYILQWNIINERFDLQEIADAWLIKHVVLDFRERVSGGGHNFLGGHLGAVKKHDFAARCRI